MATNLVTNNFESLDRNSYQTQPYHLVGQSPWPLLTSLSVFYMAIGGVGYIHHVPFSGYGLFLGFLLTSTAMILWFRDITAEGTYLGDHTFEVRKGLTLGFTLFLVSEIFVFLSVFWAYLHSALAPTIDIGNSWPPVGIETLDAFGLPLLNTGLLLSSGAYITWAHHALIQGDRLGSLVGNVITIFLAGIFTFFQYVEYTEAGFNITDSVYGSVFFSGTGLHGLHVIIGTLFIAVSTARLYFYHFTNNHHNGYEASILYWHMVDVVWILLYIIFYWWGS